MLNQKKVEIFLAKFHKSLAKQFLEFAFTNSLTSILQVLYLRAVTMRFTTRKCHSFDP